MVDLTVGPCPNTLSAQQRKPLRWESQRLTTQPCTPTCWTWRLAKDATNRVSSPDYSLMFSPLGPLATSEHLTYQTFFCNLDVFIIKRRLIEAAFLWSFSVKWSGFVLQVGKEECSCTVEEEGSTEAACWTPLFRQWPERGERLLHCLSLSTQSQLHWLCLRCTFCASCLLYIVFALSVVPIIPHTFSSSYLHLCFFFPPPLSLMLTHS